MTNELIEYIVTHPNWETELKADPYNLFIRKDADFPSLYLFSYNQVQTDFGIPLCRIARGIILEIEEGKTPKVMRRAFDKFFNWGEPHCDDIDWPSVQFQEKVDGSIMSLWYYPKEDRWVWSTNGTIDAMKTQLPSDLGKYKTFGEMADALARPFNAPLEKGITYTFELQSPWNRVVVPVSRPILTYLGSRNNLTGKEFFDNIFNLPSPRIFYFDGLEEAQGTLELLPYNEEGYVALDKNWHRAKLKGKKYLAVHHLADNGNFNANRSLALIRDGEDSEVLAYFPEYTEAFNEVRAKWKEHIRVKEIMRKEVERLKTDSNIVTKKDFAMEVLKHDKTWHPYMFAMYDGKESAVKKLDEKLDVTCLLKGN